MIPDPQLDTLALLHVTAQSDSLCYAAVKAANVSLNLELHISRVLSISDKFSIPLRC